MLSLSVLLSWSLITGDETVESARLFHLRGRVITLALYLKHLTPDPIALALELTTFEREDAEIADWSDEWDNFPDNFVIEEWGIRRVNKDQLTFE